MKKTKPRRHRHSKLIDQLGGTAEVARMLEVTQSCISQWRRRGIPHMPLKYLKMVAPEVFGEKPSR